MPFFIFQYVRHDDDDDDDAAADSISYRESLYEFISDIED